MLFARTLWRVPLALEQTFQAFEDGGGFVEPIFGQDHGHAPTKVAKRRRLA